ncbi:NADH dehydrogenase 1 beta subcomplex subunit 9/Complex 1 LYR protein [Blumeria hordei DH14]|uniref:NADH dehydrogenase [ubiquinone] 1 beta subcomplex subunit 9 n=1 Tax=Blumeria graminis f. sp. hordei (strain DH14) TaxID=546991 RepID=N1J6Z0_BLUG1|nr:NADH dehydrogenase 1 beta subcomplex subunit 9/Complex 1 LYR protein [Blumeria hordei DH14]
MSANYTVSSLYRRALKLSLDWAVHRHLWRGQAMYIRSLFEANKNVHDPRRQKAMINYHGHYLKRQKIYWRPGSTQIHTFPPPPPEVPSTSAICPHQSSIPPLTL